MMSRIAEATDAVRNVSALRPRTGLVLGSGLGALADQVTGGAVIPYSDIPHFPLSHAPGHAGRLVIGELEGEPVVVMAGRVHLYEGYSSRDVTFGIRLMRSLGASNLILTNAAGGINVSFESGTLMIIRDHINLTGHNPLVGPHEPAEGVRFPDMSDVYSRQLRTVLRKVAQERGIRVAQGVYLGLLGPSYETPAEIVMARTLGADAVGMSTVMEAIAANHAGFRVAGISCITNMAAGVLPQKLTEQEVLDTANRVRDEFGSLVRGAVRAFGHDLE